MALHDTSPLLLPHPHFCQISPNFSAKRFSNFHLFFQFRPASPPVPPIIEQGPSDPGETDPVPAKVKFSDSGSKGTVNGQNSVERDFEVSSGFSGGAGATVNWMKLSHLREAPPRHGGNVCMRGKTSHPSYLQFTPDGGNPGNSPVVHARKTHKSTMSTNCPPGHALACMESNRAKVLLLQQKHKI